MFYIIENESNHSLIERLYVDNKSLMMYTAYKILRDRTLAEDAVQQAFIKVMENLHKVDGNNCRKAQGFLVVICKNIACDIYKSKTYLNKEDVLEEIVDGKYDPVELTINRENFDRIILGIKKLNDIYQDVLLLKYSHECTNTEIAKLLGISENVVRKRLERARAQLMIDLRNEELIWVTKNILIKLLMLFYLMLYLLQKNKSWRS